MDAAHLPAIAVDRLVKQYKGATAVDGISFSLPVGSITGLLGGNGAGKTTTIAMIMGLVTPTSGKIQVLGYPMPEQSAEVLGRMNFESPYVDMPMRLTVRQNLTIFGRLYAVKNLAGRIEQLADGSYRLSPKSVPGGTEALALSAVGSSMPTLAKFDPASERQRWKIGKP